MAEFNGLFTQAELLDFSQNFLVARPEVKVDALFPDRKTENFMAEYQTLAANQQLPTIATVHGDDTEAEIGNRPALDMVSIEKMLIKRKINLTERMRKLRDHAGVRDSALKRYVFDDAGRLAEMVNMRTKVMKSEAMYKGKITVKENNLNLEVDYHVPAENLALSFDWSAPDADPSADVQKVIDMAEGVPPNSMMLSGKLFTLMRKNANLQKVILGNVGVGALIPRAQVNAYLLDEFGIQNVVINDDVYGVEKGVDAAGKLDIEKHRHIPADKISFYAANAGGSFGVGLWGVTHEEEESGPFTAKSLRQFITLTQWSTPDPVALWTKASGMFIPVLPNPSGLYVATVKTTTTVNARSSKVSV